METARENYLQLDGVTNMNYMAKYYRRVNAIPVTLAGLIDNRIVPVAERRYATLEWDIIVDVSEQASTRRLRSFAFKQQEIRFGALLARTDDSLYMSRYETTGILVKHLSGGRPQNKQVVARLRLRAAEWEQKQVCKETYFEDRGWR